jgi:hypothetical protein
MFYKEVGHSQEGAKEVTALLEAGAFDGPKPVRLLRRLLVLANATPDDLILDFFSGSATTAHAVMQLNAEDNGKRKFIMVQLPEVCAPGSEASKAGYKNICEIGKERIRRAGTKIVTSLKLQDTRKEMREYGCIKLSGTERVAESDELDRRDLSAGEEASKGGDIFAVRSDEKSGSLDTIQHSGGASAHINEGVSTFSGDSEGVGGRAGNPTVDLRKDRLPCPHGYKSGSGSVDGNQQNADCPYENTISCPLVTRNLKLVPDTGFRVLKLDSSNMKDVYYRPEEYAHVEFNLEGFADNIKSDRSDEDLLFQVMLDLGIPLSAKIKHKIVDSYQLPDDSKTDNRELKTVNCKLKTQHKVFYVNGNYLIACFGKVDTALITEIAKQKPYYAVFRDSSFTGDSDMANVEQVFNTYSPSTTRRVL